MAEGVAPIRSVAILGPGAVGGFLAALLTRSGVRVVCIGRAESVVSFMERGIALESETFGTFTVRPVFAESLSVSVDAIFVTVKAPGLKDALRRIPAERASRAVVIPLLNGIEHMETLKRHFGANIAAGSIGSFEAYLRPPATVVHVSPSVRVKLASDDAGARRALLAVQAMLVAAGIPTDILSSERDVLWEKFVRLCPLALLTAASGKMINDIPNDPALRDELVVAVREASAVAAAEGVRVDSEQVIAALGALEIGETTSLARDVAQGDAGELDAIAGAMLRAARRHGTACPTIASFAGRIAERLKQRP